MSMSDQNPVDTFKTQSRLHDLTLGTFAAIHQKAVFVMHYQLGRQAAPGRGRRGGSAQEYYFKQRSSLEIYSKQDLSQQLILPHVFKLPETPSADEV